MTTPYQTRDDMAADIVLLGAQVDAHRFVLAHILNKISDDSGFSWLSGQANIFDKDNHSSHGMALVGELDQLREIVCSLDGGVPPRQDHQRKNTN